MENEAKINTDEVVKTLKQMDYSKLNETFREAIKDSIEILKKATESELRSSGLNVTGPIRKGKYSYQPLIKGVKAEVSMSGTEGRVRIARAKANAYPPSFGEDNFALKWFESGTKDRYRKGKGYTYKANTNKKQGGARKHRNKGGWTGRLEGKEFFKKAYNKSIKKVNETLEQNINKAIQQIMNRK